MEHGRDLFLQLIVSGVAGAAGVWLFYVQHQFEDVYWERGENWDYASAALKGSSFYKLPKVLQWFSGNIGFHHIHHLSPRIPNYNLERCHRSDPLFATVAPTTLFGSLKSLRYRLWDEASGTLVGFRKAKQRRAETVEAWETGETSEEKEPVGDVVASERSDGDPAGETDTAS